MRHDGSGQGILAGIGEFQQRQRKPVHVQGSHQGRRTDRQRNIFCKRRCQNGIGDQRHLQRGNRAEIVDQQRIVSRIRK